MHTRISDDLDDALRRAAEDLRVPVSNLVRNLLEDAFDVVESVTESLGGLVNDVVGEAQDFRDHFRDDWRDQARRAVRDARERVREARREAGERVREARKRAEDTESSSSPEERAEESVPAAAEDEAEAPRRPLPEFPGIMGWQPFMLNTTQRCAGCSRSLERGDQAFLGISATGRPASYLCGECAEPLS